MTKTQTHVSHKNRTQKLQFLTIRKETELQTGKFGVLNSVKGSDGKAFPRY